MEVLGKVIKFLPVSVLLILVSNCCSVNRTVLPHWVGESARRGTG